MIIMPFSKGERENWRIAMTEQLQHLSIRPLSLEDADAVYELEEKGFPPSERCSKETLAYRLKTCPELTSGLFIREFGGDDSDSNDSYRPQQRSHLKREKLIGYILATKIDGEFITEESMSYPQPDDESSATEVRKGHVESSPVIGIHSIVIDQDYQKKNLATLLMKDFKQKLSNQQVGSKISIISKSNLIKFYERLGFVNKGKSSCAHGGEEWFNLQCDLIPSDDQ